MALLVSLLLSNISCRSNISNDNDTLVFRHECRLFIFFDPNVAFATFRLVAFFEFTS